MGRQDDEDDRDVAPLPARAISTLKLPVIAPFDSPESIVQALTHREVTVLTAGMYFSESGKSRYKWVMG